MPGVSSSRSRAAEVDWLDLDRPAEEAICFALYTVDTRGGVDDGVLKLTAQLYPLADGVGRDVVLEVEDGVGWREVGRVAVDETAIGGPQAGLKRWGARFRVEDWDASRDWQYRVVAADGRAIYGGVVRRDPVDKSEIVVGLLSCNSNEDRGPRDDIVAGLRAHDPDVLLFAGDQVYDHRNHLQSWLAFGRQFHEVTRDRPTVTIPDDHDVGQGNLWGEGGVRSVRAGGDDGGYLQDPAYVRSVELAQTWHLPDAHDPTPIGQGIGTYYTSLRVGRVDFAIIEDRKFKTGPLGALAAIEGKPGRPDLVTREQAFDPALVDVPEAVLLGERQLEFLRAGGRDWSGVEMKAVLSQTILAHIGQRSGPWVGPGGEAFDASAGEVYVMDFDSNGWPQRGRDRALEEIRRSFSVMLCGDQHLPAVAHLGVNDFRDAGVAFAAPAIMNVWARRWEPTSPRVAGDAADPLLGDFVDGFGNKVSMLAYANATREPMAGDASTFDGLAEGYGIVRFDTDGRTMTFECWPRRASGASNGRVIDMGEQYPMWPITAHQDEMYGRKPVAYLPTIEVVGADEPVVQVVHAGTGSVVYTKRWGGRVVRGHAFLEGEHIVRVGEQPGKMIELRVDATRARPEGAVRRVYLEDATLAWPGLSGSP